MAPPKRAADDIDAALERDRIFKTQKAGDASPALSEVDWFASSRSAQADPSWNDGKGKSLSRTSGMWRYSGGDKPTRTWIDRQELASFAEEAENLNLHRPVFDAKEGEAGISYAYRDLQISGNLQAFINTIYNRYLDDSSCPLPTSGFIKVWRCLLGELVPDAHIWNGIPDHIRLSNPDNAWRVAKCVFQLITRGRYFNELYNVISDTENGKSFPDFKSQTLEKECRHSKESLNLLLASLDYDILKRPSQQKILDHCDLVLRAIEGTHIPGDVRIPTGLRHEEGAVYEHMLEVIQTRKTKNAPTPKIVVVTDINKDVDDLVAMVLLKEFHRLGLVELRGFVANLHPARKRALAGRGALDALGLEDIPIGVGTEAEVIAPGQEPRTVHQYEFDECPFMAPEDTHLPEGDFLLRRLCMDANRNDEKLTFLLISGLRDINDFVHVSPALFKDNTERIVLQGGYRIEKIDGAEKLIADEAAANNSFDRTAAQQFHDYIARNAIPSTSYTKIATFATPIPEQLLIDLDATGHKIGIYLHKAQVAMDLAFYAQACSPDPMARFRDFMDQNWYLNNKSSYYQTPHPEGATLPVGDEVVQYFNKLVAYDALAALAAGGDDILEKLDISLCHPSPSSSSGEGSPLWMLHRVVGVAGRPARKADPGRGVLAQEAVAEDPGIDGEKMAQAIRALVRGSLLACQQGLPLNP